MLPPRALPRVLLSALQALLLLSLLQSLAYRKCCITEKHGFKSEADSFVWLGGRLSQQRIGAQRGPMKTGLAEQAEAG